MYGAVPTLLSRTVRVAAFPDGSVDRFRQVRAPGEDAPLTVAAFREGLPDQRTREFDVRTVAFEPGGQAVNAAQQAHALGDDVRLDGHLDDDRLSFPFETHSYGPPADVEIHQFVDGDVLYVEGDEAIADWTHEAFESIPAADAYVCGNWASIDGMNDSLRALAGDLDGVFVLDPGSVAAASAGAVRDCLDALGALDRAAEVVLSVNGRELAAIADAAGVAADTAAVRDAAGVTHVVRHETAAATVASRDAPAPIDVPNVETDDPVRHTGGGDRFSAGFAHGLAAGGTPAAAAALGNACASYYVVTGETGTADELGAFVADHASP